MNTLAVMLLVLCGRNMAVTLLQSVGKRLTNAMCPGTLCHALCGLNWCLTLQNFYLTCI